MQYAAPPLPSWTAEIVAAGLHIVDYLPERALVVAGRRESLDRIAASSWLQYGGPYLPEYKVRPAAGAEHVDFLVQIAATAESREYFDTLRARFGPFQSESRQVNDVVVAIRTSLVTAESLLLDDYVVAVEAYHPPTPSDERQAIGITGVAALSTSVPHYLSWLSARGITPAGLTNDQWGRNIVVDIADTGIDLGCCGSYSTAHPDLKGRIVYNQGTGTSYDCRWKDTSTHGTVVASIAGALPVDGVTTAGTPSAGYGFTDGDSLGSYYYGLGVAPGVRLGNTRIGSDNATVGTVSDWTRLAVTARCNTPTDVCTLYEACPATVQNHSHNQYGSDGINAGVYTLNARLFDFRVRDANDSDDAGGAVNTPLAITMSAGNYRQGTTDFTWKVMAAGTAKNVVTMGSVETHRAPSLWPAQQVATIAPVLCTPAGNMEEEKRHAAAGFNVVAFQSRRGTNDGRLKPDLLAPSTLSMGARPSRLGTSACATGPNPDPGPYPPEYIGSSGTSFAAPVAAGAIALLRYHYHKTFGFTPSPAMYKAMLVAGGRSLTGNLDRHDSARLGGTVTVGKWPNVQQGFGRIDVSDLLTSNATLVKSWIDQQVVLAPGAVMNYTVTVADPSKAVRIALAWTDAPAAARMAGDTTKVLVNDLHLSISGPFRAYGNLTDTNTGYSIVNPGCGRPSCSFADGLNNVEILNLSPQLFSDPALRTFTVRVATGVVSGVGVPGPGVTANQDYALFVLNGTLQ